MAAHYTREKSKYGTLAGSIITWPVEYTSPNDPNNPDSSSVLPAGYLRCDGQKYNASQYPNLAAICGTGANCKFVRTDENGDPIQTLGDEEFVVPDLGSKYPRPVSGGDAGVYNNIIEETKNNTFIKRSGIGIEASSNVGAVAEVTYSGRFALPSQTFSLKGKPSWTWGTAGYTDEESLDAAAFHPHMHFSSTNRVRVKPKSGATGGVVQLEEIFYFSNDGSINGSYNGTSFVGYGSGTGEVGGFVSPGFGSGYVAFGGTYTSSLVITREWTITLNFVGYQLLIVTSIVGNDNNGGERPNNVGEGIYIVWPGGEQSGAPLLPARQESGLQGAAYDNEYANWSTQGIPIPEAYRNGTYTITFRQTVQSSGADNFDGTELKEENLNNPAFGNCYDMCGIARVGFGAGFEEDTSLVGGEIDFPAGQNYFQTASTVNINKWLQATSYSGNGNPGPGSNQPACFAIASASISQNTPTQQTCQVTWYWNFCNTGCSLNNLRCYCLLTDGLTYASGSDWFGIPGTRFTNYATCFPLNCFSASGGSGASYSKNGQVPATYVTGKQNMPFDWKGLPLSDVLPLNSNISSTDSYPQARNVFSETEESTSTLDEPTLHNHKIQLVREDHTFSVVTDPILIEPDALNTTVQLQTSSLASIDAASAPFIVLEYLIKT